MKYDVIAIGETLIDLISRDFVASLQFAGEFGVHLGGEPVNVATNAARLGASSAIVTKVGHDGLGEFASAHMKLAGVATDLVVQDPVLPTSVALVTRSVATPDFLIHRGADANLTIADLPEAADTEWVHTSAFALSRRPLRDAVVEFVGRAKRAGATVSLDPNYHPRVWGGERPEPVFAELFPMVDVVKASQDDCRRMFGQDVTLSDAIDQLHDLGAKHVIMTSGSGPVAFTDGGTVRHIATPTVDVRDVTGAGDAFWAGYILATLRGVGLDLAVAAGMALAALAVQTVGPFDRNVDLDGVLADAKVILENAGDT